MSQRNQLIIDCGLNEDNLCQLRNDSAKHINIQVQQAFSQYHYYLLFYNHLKKNCQLSVQVQNSKESHARDYSNLFIKIFYQNQQLFNASFVNLLSKKVDLLNLLSQSSRLYRLEFYIMELETDFSLDFDLNFLLNCQNQSEVKEKKSEVLGSKKHFREKRPIQTGVNQEKSINNQRFFLFSALLIFLLLLILIFIFYRLLFKKKKNYKLAQRKEIL